MLKTCQDLAPIKQCSKSILSQHLILCNSIFTHVHGILFSFRGGQTLFIQCPLKYIYSVTINLNLQHCDIKHYATAVLSKTRDLRRTGILHIAWDFAYD